jgi:hypothetical protein
MKMMKMMKKRITMKMFVEQTMMQVVLLLRMV